MPTCLQCGKNYEEKRKQKGRQVFCSAYCRLQHWQREHRELVAKYHLKYNKKVFKRVCKICGKPLLYGSKAQFCSESCRKQKMHQSEKKFRDARKMKVYELLGGAKCVNCGCDNLKALEINHKKGGGCKFRNGAGGSSLVEGIYYHRLNPEDFEITCRVCNALHYMKLRGIKGWKIIWKEGGESQNV
jgi:predicted nucleic acid-binding Zn ribbon protein